MKIQTKIVGTITLLASVLTVASLSTARVSAANAPLGIEIGSYGLVGVAAGQTARLNVVLGTPDPQGPQYPPGPPVRVQLSLLDANGNLAVPSQCDPRSIDCAGGGSQVSVNLGPGQSASLDVRGDQLAGILGRAEIRAVARVYPPGPPVVPVNAVLTTLEIIDNATQKTAILNHPPSPCRGGD
jgi:hypothetical protein